MKKILLAATLGIILSSFKGNPKKSATETAPEVSYGEFAQPTQDRDTLYLLENHSMSKITYDLWKNDSTWNGCNPCIRFVSFGEMEKLKCRLESARANAE
jgi:hypothetical protein